MTEGERMVWAVSYGHRYSERQAARAVFNLRGIDRDPIEDEIAAMLAEMRGAGGARVTVDPSVDFVGQNARLRAALEVAEWVELDDGTMWCKACLTRAEKPPPAGKTWRDMHAPGCIVAEALGR